MEETALKLLFKQRVFSWFDSYDIYDENGNTIFTVKGQLSWGHCLQISDANGQHIGTVKERVFTFLPKFELYIGDAYVGEIKKDLSFFTPKFTVTCKDWYVSGDIFGWNYTVFSGNTPIMSAQKRLLNWADTYEIDVINESDKLYALMIVLAIDAAQCSQND